MSLSDYNDYWESSDETLRKFAAARNNFANSMFKAINEHNDYDNIRDSIGNTFESMLESLDSWWDEMNCELYSRVEDNEYDLTEDELQSVDFARLPKWETYVYTPGNDNNK